MRFTAIFPFLCALGALVLALLCLFAGSNKGFLQNADVLTLNVSQIGHTTLNSTDGNGGILSSLENSIEGEINGEINNLTTDLARLLNIHDFYSVHILDFCEGYYTPNATDKHAHKNVSNCSNRTALFHFNPQKIIEEELKPGITLADLKWPDQIESAITVLEVAGKAMFVCYCIGIAFSAIALIGAVVGLLANGRLSALVNFLLCILAFLSLGIASGISTAIAVKAVHAVNKYGKEIGIAAYKGSEFMAMTWVATVLMFLGACLWIFECCAGRRKSKSYVHEPKERY